MTGETMRRKLNLPFCAVLAGLGLLCGQLACSQSDRETERQREAEAREKTARATERAKEETRKLGQELKQEARQLDRNIDRALSGTGTAPPDEKLRQAGVKLDHAAMIAKVKAKLAADVGLSTVTSVDVDATGQVVTLRGTVSSEDQKQSAENAVRQLSGVTKVINLLRVQ
jgi:osmotically-inducible protein OsmY